MRDQPDALIGAPQHERPRRAVPQAAEHHRDQQVAVGRPAAAAAAAERLVQVVAQPRRQADVPVPPELARVGHRVGEAEVDVQLDAEQLREAPRHVGVAGEVAVDLQREGVGRDQHVAARGRKGRREHRVDHRRQVVGDDDLLEEAGGDQPGAGRQVLAPDRARRRELRHQRRRPQDRARHEVREVGDEERVVDEAADRRHVAAVHVDDVGHRHERVERDAERQDDGEDRIADVEADGRQRPRRRVDEEAGVLEEAEHGEQEAERGPQDAQRRRARRPHGRPAERGGGPVADQRRRRQQPGEAPVPDRVEVVAGREQPQVLGAMRPAAGRPRRRPRRRRRSGSS